MKENIDHVPAVQSSTILIDKEQKRIGCVMAFPSPEYERLAHHRAARIFTLVMAVLSVVIIGGTILVNLETITLDDIIALIAPFVFIFFFWLFVKWMRKETGVEWVPWAP